MAIGRETTLLPLHGVRILDSLQFPAGPSCILRPGAERLLVHGINRNKAGMALQIRDTEETGLRAPLGVVQSVAGSVGGVIRTSTCPIRIDTRVPTRDRAGPPPRRDMPPHGDITHNRTREGAVG